MRSLALLAVGAIGLADATPLIDLACPVVVKLLTQPLVSAQAKAFCSSVLDITTATTTVTPKVTPQAVTSVVTSTTTADTSTETLTESSTEVPIITSRTVLPAVVVSRTVTSTSRPIISCFNGATVLSPYLLPTAGSAEKRGQQYKAQPKPQPTPNCFRDWKPAAIKTACKCLQLTRPTSTITSPTTLVASTSTSTSFVTESPSTQLTTTTVITSPSTTVTTVTPDISTEIATVTLVIPTPALNGMNYFLYQNQHDYGLAGPGPNPANFQGDTFYQSGVIQDVNTVRVDNGDAYFPGGRVNGNNIHGKFQGFFYAETAGEYTFSTPNTIDNQLTVWVRDIAYGQTPWTYGNAAYDALRSGQDSSLFRGGQISLTLAAGEMVPMTLLWGNNSQTGVLYFRIRTPSGAIFARTANLFALQCPGGPFTRRNPA